MKKKLPGLLILFVISLCSSFLYLNYTRGEFSNTLVLPNLLELVIWTLVIFAILTLLVFSIKTTQKTVNIPDGYQNLYNECNQITKEGVFSGGKLINGSKHVYSRDDTLSHTEIYRNGVSTGKNPQNNNISSGS